MPNAILLAGTLGFASAYFYAIFATIHVRSFGDPVGPRMFPILLGCALLLSAAMMIYETWWKPKPQNAAAQPEGRKGQIVVLAVALLTLAYFLTFEWLGYVVSTSIYLMLLTSYFHKGKTLINIATAVVFSLATYLLFARALQVSLPSGVLPF